MNRIRIGSIVTHCHEFDRTVAFWAAALHYVPREPAKGGWVVLRDPDGKGPNLPVQARHERRPAPPAAQLDSPGPVHERPGGGSGTARLTGRQKISLAIPPWRGFRRPRGSGRQPVLRD